MNPLGRKPKYNPASIPLIQELSLLGCTDARIAEILGVGADLFSRWQRRYPELLQALKKSRDIADSKVASSLYKRACGFFYTESKSENGKVTKTVKHAAPDTGACIYWLNNRQREYWRQTYHIDERARSELESEIERELERLAVLEAKGEGWLQWNGAKLSKLEPEIEG